MEPVPWWRETTVYQIYPRSFFDTNHDGIGDLDGVLEKLDYLHALGVQTLWFSPFYPSPQRDFGYDIRDHFGVAPEYGTVDGWKRLLDAIHARGMKVVLDMVLNHTSDEHPFFQASRRDASDPKRDFYIWRKGRKPGPPAQGGAPPNNWRSMLGPSGWQYDAQTDAWYWATFLPFQPDLNYRNPAVKEAMFGVVRHWLAQGVDGLRLDIFNAIFKDPEFRNNPPSLRVLPSEDNPDGFFQRNLYTINHPDTFAFARELRAVVDEFSDPPRFLVGEVFGTPQILKKYCGPDGNGLNLVFLFKTFQTPFSAYRFRQLIEEYEREFPAPLLPTYVYGNHDRPRLMERIGDDPRRAKLLAMLQLTVRGVPFMYYGEEIGMQNHDLPLKQALDPLASRYRFLPQPLVRALRRRGMLLNRDECRTPMQWSGAKNAGFTDDKTAPWLPVLPQHGARNVAAQAQDSTSILTCYRRLLRLRQASAALRGGALTILPQSYALEGQVLAYARTGTGEAGGEETLRVLLNFSDEPAEVFVDHAPHVVALSTVGDVIDWRGTTYVLRPYEGAVFRTQPADGDAKTAETAG